jgi:hypothetical protein
VTTNHPIRKIISPALLPSPNLSRAFPLKNAVVQKKSLKSPNSHLLKKALKNKAKTIRTLPRLHSLYNSTKPAKQDFNAKLNPNPMNLKPKSNQKSKNKNPMK